MLIEARLPDGASINRTSAVAQEVEQIVLATPGVATITSVVGFSMLDGIATEQQCAVLRQPEAVRQRTPTRPASGACWTISTQFPDPAAHRHSVQPAADHRPRHQRVVSNISLQSYGGASPAEMAARGTRPCGRGE